VRNEDIQIRDPFVLPVPEEGMYYLFGTTDPDCWRAPGIGFDVYKGSDLARWEGPFPAFRPEPGFWGKRNFWAPEVHRYRGGYYMLASFYADGRRRATQALFAERPEGPYRMHSPEPLTPPEWECLDGTLFVDAYGDPWLVFCHEWVQARDGEVCARRLSHDLREPIGEAELLFRASEAPWTKPHRRRDGSIDPLSRVSDGPFMHRCESGTLLMLWSSFSGNGYALGVARSASGGIEGPWIQEREPLMNRDSGHGMAFRSFDGRLMLSLHAPNDTPNERPVFIELIERGGSLTIVGEERG
jgi:hypothetical protein